MGQLLAVTRNAFVESIRQPIFVVLLALVGFGIVLAPYVSAYTFEEDTKLATDMGLSMILIGGLFLAAFTATGVISREIENKTVLTVVSKPLPRPIFITGKFLGVAAALTLAMWSWAILFLLARRQGAFENVRIPWDVPVLLFGSLAILGAAGLGLLRNYLFGKSFSAVFSTWLAIFLSVAFLAALPLDHDFSFQSPAADVDVQVLAAVVFLFEAVWLLCAVAVAVGTRLGTVATLLICFVVFFLGLTSDYAFGSRAAESATFDTVYKVVPNMGFLWLADALTQEHPINWQHFWTVSAYCGLLTAAALAIAIALFQTRQTA